MSNEIKPQALNLYGILDNELARMHVLMQTYMALPAQNQQYPSGNMSSPNPHGNMPAIYRRIQDIQDMLLLAVKAHDPAIQAAIAELALTGVSESK